MEKKFYCSQKFWWLSVDLEKLETLSCCAATPTKIDFGHLEKNPGEIFNSPVLVKERQDMLADVPVDSCSATCWQAEAKSMTSRRLLMNSDQRTHTNIFSTPETLHIIVGTDCNMSCVYCCKTYSSSWARDLLTHGPYKVATDDDRYELSTRDKIVMKLSQKEISNGRFNQQLLEEIQVITKTSNLREIIITGGEPFLYLGLEELIARVSGKANTVKIWSGLGINSDRFRKELEKISKFDGIEVVISAEATGNLYELLRYGNSWQRFQDNIKILEQQSIKHSFYATVTNLSLFGMTEFLDYVGEKSVTYAVCTDPAFLSVNVLDDVSKEKIKESLSSYPTELQKAVATDLFLGAETDRDQLKIYLKEFADRRNIDLNFLPSEFIAWLS